jgi:Protein of unknown function (DUF4242)
VCVEQHARRAAAQDLEIELIAAEELAHRLAVAAVQPRMRVQGNAELHEAGYSGPASPCSFPKRNSLPIVDRLRRAWIAAPNARREHAQKRRRHAKVIIEREIHNIGTADGNAIREVARKSNGIVEGFGGGIEWLEFFITGDKVYCVYLARDEAIIRKHAEKGGLPANRIVEVKRMMDPTSVLA